MKTRNIRISEDLDAFAVEAARRNQVSVNELFVTLVARLRAEEEERAFAHAFGTIGLAGDAELIRAMEAEQSHTYRAING